MTFHFQVFASHHLRDHLQSQPQLRPFLCSAQQGMLIASTAILKPMTALPVKLPVMGSVAPALKLAMASLGKYAKMAAVPQIILVGIQTSLRS